MEEFGQRAVPVTLEAVAEAFKDAEHIVFVFPLWLGKMPALLKGFLEQEMRPGVAFAYSEPSKRGLTPNSLSISSSKARFF